MFLITFNCKIVDGKKSVERSEQLRGSRGAVEKGERGGGNKNITIGLLISFLSAEKVST